MIKHEFYCRRKDGIELYKTFSDEEYYIRQEDTGNIYEVAIDPSDTTHIYIETEDKIPRKNNESEDVIKDNNIQDAIEDEIQEILNLNDVDYE